MRQITVGLLSIILTAGSAFAYVGRSLIQSPADNPKGLSGECADKFLDGKMPTVPVKFKPQARFLCYQGFAVLHSGLSRTALWSAERLSRANISQARDLERVDDFHPEPRLPSSQRSEIEDFRRSGFDRGHLAPSGDMPNPAAQGESFTLANVVPQIQNLNRYSWADLEKSVRRDALRYGSAYVVTGVLYDGAQVKMLRGRVAVPTRLWKAVYVQHRTPIVYIATNEDEPRWTQNNVRDFYAATGINPFPTYQG